MMTIGIILAVLFALALFDRITKASSLSLLLLALDILVCTLDIRRTGLTLSGRAGVALKFQSGALGEGWRTFGRFLNWITATNHCEKARQHDNARASASVIFTSTWKWPA